MKIAIVLFNLGGPDSPEAVKPFLFNLFNDPAIIGAPNFIRKNLAKFISSRRAPTAREIYSHIGGASPILKETQAQADALVEALHEVRKDYTFTAHVCMRYWHPMSEQVVSEVKAENPDRIILLPLYPQFSTTTSGSSFNNWKEEAAKQGLNKPTTTLCCYPQDTHFTAAHVASIRNYYERARQLGDPRILFSAHGLPEKVIKAGDPYQWQVEQTATAVANKLNIENLDWKVSYQSKVGPMKWIGPSTETEITRAAQDRVPLIIVPIAFVSEHSETLVELDIEYKELADKAGIEGYFRVPTLSLNNGFITSLKALVLNLLPKDPGIYSHKFSRICPDACTQCPCEKPIATEQTGVAA